MTMDARTAQAWTLTFYAYKGGTGRTLALANVARYMAEDLGYRIGLVDLDLESPGLSHEPLCSELEPRNRTKARSREIDDHLGFVDLLNTLSVVRATAIPEIRDEELDLYVLPIESEGDGSVVLMPTAKGSVSKSKTYDESLKRFLRYLTETDADEVANVTQAVLEAFIRRYNLDFLFLDGRTGTGSFFPIYTYAVPQLLVLFFGLNEQNISGSLSVLQAETETSIEEAPVLLVASPVPTVGPEMLESRLGAVERELEVLRQQRTLASGRSRKRYIYELPRSISFMLPYSDLASYEEAYFPRHFPHSQLAQEYRRLANAIETLVLKQPTVSQAEERSQAHRSQSKKGSTRNRNEKPLRIAAENITYSHFRTFFEQQYGCSAAQLSLTELPEFTDAGRRLNVCSQLGIDFQVDLWPAEEKTAPWEVLADGQELTDPPDVLLIPQIYLGPVSQAQSRGRLLNLTEQRLSARSPSRPEIFQYRFLDHYYPGWRRWCSFGARVMGVPFSVNTMLFCANEDLLSEVCRPYWEARGQARIANRARFLPSSWPALLETLRQFNRLAPTDRTWQPFRMILHERGLYYEWLNIVVALGGVDLQEGEGRLLEGVSVGDKKVVSATELFRDLAANTGLPDQRVQMFQQIDDFGKGRLALYVAWTDSFQFRSPDRAPGVAAETGRWETKIVEVPGRQPPHETLRIHLGQLPRDVNYPRKSVVDGWLMVFPETGGRERQRRAFDFASTFLRPEIQLALLQKGFPTASRWAIEKELEVHDQPFGRDRSLGERNYLVFLRALRTAIVEGHWVPSPENGRTINTLIQESLREILGGEDPQDKLAETGERINSMIRDLQSSRERSA